MSTPADKIKKKLPKKPAQDRYVQEKEASEQMRGARTAKTEKETASEQDWSNRNLSRPSTRRTVTPSGNQSPAAGKMNRSGAGSIYTDAVRWSLDEKERIRNRYNAKREEMRNLGSTAAPNWEKNLKAQEDADMSEVDRIVERDFQNYKKSKP